jgi:hypothetical protein
VSSDVTQDGVVGWRVGPLLDAAAHHPAVSRTSEGGRLMKARVTAQVERAKLAPLIEDLPKKQATFLVRGEWPEVSGPCARVEVEGKEVKDEALRAKVAAVLPFSRPGDGQTHWSRRRKKKKK